MYVNSRGRNAKLYNNDNSRIHGWTRMQQQVGTVVYFETRPKKFFSFLKRGQCVLYYILEQNQIVIIFQTKPVAPCCIRYTKYRVIHMYDYNYLKSINVFENIFSNR